ncbi:MAG: cobalt transporter CbiM [Desulfobacterales bacterium]|nr:cobalt transporter CbiM [Desulfobacterales bacterium]
MHISEGILSGPVLISGMAIAAAGTAIGLKKLRNEDIAKTGMLAASFFVASLIHIPIGPAGVHLILSGIVGLLLGWAAFPAILVALTLQATFFQHGGITTLGVNTVIMALPAVVCHYLFAPLIWKNKTISAIGAFGAGSIAIVLNAVIAGLALIYTDEGLFKAAALIMGAHLPVMIIEGIISIFCVAFLKKVQPALLPGFKSINN